MPQSAPSWAAAAREGECRSLPGLTAPVASFTVTSFKKKKKLFGKKNNTKLFNNI